jgi:dolichol-phosphate mannosyltransferase
MILNEETESTICRTSTIELNENQPECVLVLPCYNEGKNLPPLIDAVDSVLGGILQYHILAVNDGSSDNTGEILNELSHKYPVKVLNHEKNKGLPSAMRTGLIAASQSISNEGYIITMDADNTHNPILIPKMIGLCREGADLVVCSRYVQGGNQFGVPYYRVLLSDSINSIVRLRTQSNIKDFTSGYRCYSAYAVRKLISTYNHRFIESTGFEVTLELLVKSLNLSLKVAETPISLNYRLKQGKSSMKVMRTVARYLQVLFSFGRWKPPSTQTSSMRIDAS